MVYEGDVEYSISLRFAHMPAKTDSNRTRSKFQIETAFRPFSVVLRLKIGRGRR